MNLLPLIDLSEPCVLGKPKHSSQTVLHDLSWLQFKVTKCFPTFVSISPGISPQLRSVFLLDAWKTADVLLYIEDFATPALSY